MYKLVLFFLSYFDAKINNNWSRLIVEMMVNTKSSLLVDRVGMIMFALYQVTVTIVLVNILIAMMSHSFEDVQVSPGYLAITKQIVLLHLQW